jgi:nitrite reductase (NADH) small subunit
MATVSEEPVLEIPVCAVEEIPLGLGRAFKINDLNIAIFRTRAGEIRALDNTCPHRGGPLADGMLAGNSAVCPFHAFRFCLQTGKCDDPNTSAVKTYSTRIEDGWIILQLAKPWSENAPE